MRPAVHPVTGPSHLVERISARNSARAGLVIAVDPSIVHPIRVPGRFSAITERELISGPHMEPKFRPAVYGRVTNLGCAMAVILIVEDEAQVRVLSESFLQEQGHQTLSAATPDEALAVLHDSDSVDILFTDVELQGDVQAGLSLAQAAIEQQAVLRVLYTSCHPITDGMKALFVETSAFLPKPYTIDQLQAILAVDFGIKPHPGSIPPVEQSGQPLPGL
jgi:two-component system, response regulator PdtaR